MPGPQPKYAITLTPEQEARLQHLSTRYMAAFATVQRAQLLLLAHRHPQWQNATLRREPVVTKGEEKVLMRRGFCAVVRRPADCMGSAVG